MKAALSLFALLLIAMPAWLQSSPQATAQSNAPAGTAASAQNKPLSDLLDADKSASGGTVSVGVSQDEVTPCNSFGEFLLSSWGTSFEGGKYFVELWCNPTPAADGARSVRFVNTGNLSAVVEVNGDAFILDGNSAKVSRVTASGDNPTIKVRTTCYRRKWSAATANDAKAAAGEVKPATSPR